MSLYRDRERRQISVMMQCVCDVPPPPSFFFPPFLFFSCNVFLTFLPPFPLFEQGESGNDTQYERLIFLSFFLFFIFFLQGESGNDTQYERGRQPTNFAAFFFFFFSFCRARAAMTHSMSEEGNQSP